MASIYQSLADLEANNRGGVLCTIIRSSGSTPRHAGSKLLVFEDGSFTGTVGGGEVEARVIHAALAALADGRPQILHYDMVNPSEGDPGICGGQLEVYLEPILARPELLIVGGGHVGKALAHLARWLNFRVIVSDDRAEFCTPEANPDADLLLYMKMSEIPSAYPITPRTYIAVTTRGVSVDIEGLPALLTGNTPSYIGVIGSKRRWALTQKGLLDAGISKELIQRVHSPIGLELNAETPEEIAVSILSEIIMLRNGASGKPMGNTGS